MNHIPLNHVPAEFPFATATIYGYHCRKEIDWLTRIGPDGNRGRILWIKVAEFNAWCRNRGYKCRLSVDGDGRSARIDSKEVADLAPYYGGNHAV